MSRFAFYKKKSATKDDECLTKNTLDITKHKRSQSLGNPLDYNEEDNSAVCKISDDEPDFELHGEVWEEISLLKSISPVVICILPGSAQDIVASALLAVGSYPLIAEEPDDVVKYLSTCNGAVLCDTSARVDLVQAVLDNYKVGTIPLVLLCWESGTSDTRKNLSRKIAELCNPTLITGRLGDIHALGLDIMSRVAGIIDSTDDKDETDSYSSLKPATPVPVEKSIGASPRFKRKKDVEKGHKRQRTAIPHMIMKGHFRHESMKDVQIPEAHTSARKLAAQLGTYVHIYETNMITCGEFFVEINNTHIGMENVHSTVHCCAAIIASVIGCAEIRKKETLSLLECAHGLSLYYVAAEEATCKVSTKHEVMLPGSLRTTLIDYLFLLDEKTVRTNANIVQHNSLP